MNARHIPRAEDSEDRPEQDRDRIVNNVAKMLERAGFDATNPDDRARFAAAMAYVETRRRQVEKWERRRAVVIGGAIVALISAMLSVVVPWLVKLLHITLL
jgi:hypothetical protein